ncbi:reverse transcriptase domain-containing protein [Tanacetum coccineum]
MPIVKESKHGNQAGSSEARGKVYALGGEKPIKTLTALQMISMLKERFFTSYLFEENATKEKNSLSTAAIERLIEQLIKQRVTEALAAQDANRNSGNGNGNGNGNDSGSHDSRSGGRRTSHTARDCTYKEFFNCQPLNFKGTEGALGLAYWFEKMESVFHISNCTMECQVKYATCTFLGGALTFWNSHVMIVCHDAAYGMPWKTLMKMMTKNYYPRSDIKKLETELWNLVVKGTDVESYTQCFQELILLCSRMVLDESDKVEKYTGGFPDSIQGSVMASKQKMLQEEIELARSLMDQKVCAYADRQPDNKRRMYNNSRDNNAQQLPYKRQNVARAYTAGPGEKKEYAGTLPL